MTAVHADGVFQVVLSHTVTWLVVTRTEACGPKYSSVSSFKKYQKISLTPTLLSSCQAVRCHGDHFYVSLQPCYGLPLRPPSADKASGVHLLQLLLCLPKILEDLLHIEVTDTHILALTGFLSLCALLDSSTPNMLPSCCRKQPSQPSGPAVYWALKSNHMYWFYVCPCEQLSPPKITR